MKTQHGQGSPFVINARYQAHRITGVQRYAHEIANRLEGQPELLAPAKGRGAMGHLWEQLALPRLAGGRLLWSPCGAGPIAYSRQVVTIHDLFPIENPEWYSAPYARWYKLMFEQLASKAVHLIAVSDYTRDRIVKVLRRDPSEITVVHNGPSATTKLTSALEASKTCAALALPTRRYVLSLSSLEGRKNLPTILAAWREAQRHLPDNVWQASSRMRRCSASRSSRRSRRGCTSPAMWRRSTWRGCIPERRCSCFLHSLRVSACRCWRR
jgi:glycosyltransferase involved in cell wall biosynthesis